MKKAIKHDAGKSPMHLVSPEFMFALGGVLKHGADKYGERNWETEDGMDWSRLYAAAQRHLWAWWAGEDDDPESGRSHIDHASACLMMLSHYAKNSDVFSSDDRPNSVKAVSGQHIRPYHVYPAEVEHPSPVGRTSED